MADEKGNSSSNEQGNDSSENQGSTLTQEAFDALSAKSKSFEDSLKTTKADMMKYKNKARELETAQESARKDKADGATDVDTLRTEFQGIFDSQNTIINDLRTTQRNTDVYGAVRSIATKLGATHPDDVVTLLKGRISFDDKGNTIIDGGKSSKETGKLLTLDELTTSFMASRQDLIKPSGNSGAGSTSSGGGGSAGNQPQHTATQLGAMTNEQYAEARKKNGGMIASVKQ